ncbi:hypothetical protein [Sebaldella termitidis]|uniref:hypothetical protein n=1 Tax=Sebaldella termitidis TaxID=826 RepID=UPI003EB869EF
MEYIDIIKELFAVSRPKGYTAEEISAVRKLYGGIPLFLEQFYLELGRSDELLYLQDELMLPGKYPVFLDYEYMIFFNENQGVCQAGIAKSDVKMENPPVYVGYDNKNWVKTAETLSDFLTAMYGYQASLCLEYSSEAFYWVSDQEIQLIEQSFSKRQEGLSNWLNFRVDLYEKGEGRITLMHTGGDVQMMYAANNKKDFKEIQAVLENIGEII